MKQGIYTSEFWIALAGQALAVLVIAGVITPADRDSLGGALTNAITAVAALVASFGVVKTYIHSRTILKDRVLGASGPAGQRGGQQGQASGVVSKVLPVVLVFLLSAGGAGAEEGPVANMFSRPGTAVDRVRPSGAANAWHPGYAGRPAGPQGSGTSGPRRAACLFANKQAQMELLREISANQRLILSLLQHPQLPAPTPPGAAPVPQVIVLTPQLSPPLQQIPLGGPPLQQIPLGGPPKQDIPLGGPPKQDIPLGGAPRQEIPLGGPPRQQIDPGTPTAPRQQIPIAQPPMPRAEPTSVAYQRFRGR